MCLVHEDNVIDLGSRKDKDVARVLLLEDHTPDSFCPVAHGLRVHNLPDVRVPVLQDHRVGKARLRQEQ